MKAEELVVRQDKFWSQKHDVARLDVESRVKEGVRKPPGFLT